MFTIDDFKGLATDIGGIVGQGVSIYEQIKKAGKTTVPTPTATSAPKYNPNVSISDFAAKPYYPLLIGGAALLVIVLLLKK